jgi:hypothetical protein
VEGDEPPAWSTVEAYDPVTDTWAWKADIPTARAFASTAVVSDTIYVIGGQRTGWLGPTYRTVEAYDPVTDTWTSKADMGTARMQAAVGVVATSFDGLLTFLKDIV